MSTNLQSTFALSQTVTPQARMVEAMGAAASMVAPLWPLRDFVAVNPFVGLGEGTIASAARTMGRVGAGRLSMNRSFYAEAILDGTIRPEDIDAAAAAAPDYLGLAGDGRSVLHRAFHQSPESGPAPVSTFADLATNLCHTDWTSFVVDRIGVWAESHYGDDAASWKSPWRSRPAFEAWKAEARLDRQPEVFGVRSFRRYIDEQSDDPLTAARAALQMLGLADLHYDGLRTYFHRLLTSIRGWAGYARYLGWHGGDPRPDGELIQLLTIRLVWDAALHAGLSEPAMEAAWKERRKSLSRPRAIDEATELDLVLHDAYERSRQRALLSNFSVPRPEPRRERASVQAVFCIDVRSEPLRRALERDADVETLGVAGFFGMPVEVRAPGEAVGQPRCPALIEPALAVDDHAAESPRWWGSVIETYKKTSVSAFGFVETFGLGYACRLVADGLGLRRARPISSLVDRRGIESREQVALAGGLLRTMSLTRDFARLVVLCGHGARTVNNPHGAGLECGACCGHDGAPNARLAAAMLNDPDVRRALSEEGIDIPADTVFVAAVHETVTDRVTVLNRREVPASHIDDLECLERRLEDAGREVRTERALTASRTDHRETLRLAERRSRDWSEVRPEWGLAGCSSFIVGPRKRTRGVDFGGRAFLHSYQWRDDEDFSILESLMTAPLVVATWISLQYYGSTVDPERLGAGNKVLHNVVGSIGVVEGNHGDLRVGLPMQSVHDGGRLVHEPVRLSAVIEAPIAAMNSILARNPELNDLAGHGWFHLFAMNDDGVVTHRYVGRGAWTEVRRNEDPDGRQVPC